MGTATWKLAGENGITTVAEAFVDRAYTSEGLLVPRDQPDVMVTDPDIAAGRAVSMVSDGKVTSVDGVDVPLTAEALLIHSDTPGAVDIARATREALTKAGGRYVNRQAVADTKLSHYSLLHRVRPVPPSVT